MRSLLLWTFIRVAFRGSFSVLRPRDVLSYPECEYVKVILYECKLLAVLDFQQDWTAEGKNLRMIPIK